MNKSRIQATVPPDVLREVDRHVENRSELITRLLRNYVDMEESKDEELVKERNRIQNELESLQEEKVELEDKIRDLESQLESVELALDRKDEQEDVLTEAAQAIAPEWREKRKNTRDPEAAFEKVWISEKFGMWEEKIDASREDLKLEVKSVVEENYEELL